MPRACGTGSLFTGSDTHPTILCTYLVPLQLGLCFTVRVGADFMHAIVRFFGRFSPVKSRLGWSNALDQHSVATWRSLFIRHSICTAVSRLRLRC